MPSPEPPVSQVYFTLEPLPGFRVSVRNGRRHYSGKLSLIPAFEALEVWEDGREDGWAVVDTWTRPDSTRAQYMVKRADLLRLCRYDGEIDAVETS